MTDLAKLGFGCSGLLGSGTRRERDHLLGEVIDNGISHFDVARQYGLGRAEFDLGRYLSRCTTRPAIATKFGIEPVPLSIGVAAKALRTLHLQSASSNVLRLAYRPHRFDARYAKRALETSLRALKVDRIDYYFLHECFVEEAEREDVAEFLLRSQASGKIGAAGVATGVEAAREISRSCSLYSVFQYENNLLHAGSIGSSAKHLTVTHRAVGARIDRLHALLVANRTSVQGWIGKYRVDVFDKRTLADAMLSFAVRANPAGLVLFSTTKADRVKHNANVARTPILDIEQASTLRVLVSELS